MQAFKFNFQLSNCQLFNQWDFVDLKVANQKARKAIDSVRIILTKIHLSFLRKVNGVFSPHLFSAFDHFGVLLLQKNKLTSVFYVSVLLLMTKMSQSAHEKLNSHSLEAQGEERKRERAQGARCITGILSTFRRFPWSPREPISEEQGGHRWGCGQRIKFSQVRNMSGNSVYIVSEKKSTF